MKFTQAIATLFLIGSTFAFAIDDQAENVINKCYEELTEYQDCYVKYADVTESELQKNCEIYKSDKCQKYFEDPIKYVPTCSDAIGFRSISMLNHMDLTISHFNEICSENEEEISNNESSNEESNNDKRNDIKCSQRDLRNISGQCSSRYEGCEYIECTYIPTDEYMKDCERKYNNKKMNDYEYNWIQQYYENVKKQSEECKLTDDNNTEEINKEESSNDKSNNIECSQRDLRNISGQCSSRYEGCEYIKCTYIPTDEYMKDCERKYNNKEMNDYEYNWIKQYYENVKKQSEECKPTDDNETVEVENINEENNKENEKYEKILNKCYEELGEYQDCYVKYAGVTEIELQNNCEIYKSDKCQKYFEDPIKYVPTCSEAIGFKSISMLNNVDLTCNHYNEICNFNRTSKVEGKCGPRFGSCAVKGACCSKYGYCGTSESHCGIGCQPKYGLCQ